MIVLLIQPLIISCLIALFITPLTIALFRKMNWLEDPKLKSHPKVVHQYPVPRGGGIPIFLAILFTSFLFLSLDIHLKIILLAGLINLIVGIIDDLFDISPYIRLITNLISALLIITSGIKIKFITNPLGGILSLDQPILFFNLADLLTLIWIVWSINVVGWSGGVEGQLPGFVAIASLIIGILSLRFSQDMTQWPVIILTGAVAGAYLGFLPFNFHPQKIMPGYSGKSLAGFFLAVLAILSGAKLATVILTLGVPMLDGAWAIIRRVKRGKLPVWGDAEHLHHLLLQVGLSQPLIAILYWLFSAILGLIVLHLNSKQKIYALIMVTMGFALLVTSLKALIKRNHSNFSA